MRTQGKPWPLTRGVPPLTEQQFLCELSIADLLDQLIHHCGKFYGLGYVDVRDKDRQIAIQCQIRLTGPGAQFPQRIQRDLAALCWMPWCVRAQILNSKIKCRRRAERLRVR